MGTYTNRKIYMTLWSDCTCCSANDTAIELVNIENFSSLGDFCFDFSIWPELKGKLNIFFVPHEVRIQEIIISNFQTALFQVFNLIKQRPLFGIASTSFVTY